MKDRRDTKFFNPLLSAILIGTIGFIIGISLPTTFAALGWDLGDDNWIQFGTDDDIRMLYDEAGDNRLEVHDGSSNLLAAITDDGTTGSISVAKSYFGTATAAGAGAVADATIAIADGTSPTTVWSEADSSASFATASDVSATAFEIAKTHVTGQATIRINAISGDNSSQNIELGGAASATGTTNIRFGQDGGNNVVILRRFGDTGTNGPEDRWHNADGEQATTNYWVQEPDGTDFKLEPDDNPGAFLFSGAGTLTVEGGFIPIPVTITTDATPTALARHNIHIGAWTTSNDITDFDNETAGQTIMVLGGDTDCNIVDGSGIELVGDTTWNAAVNAKIELYSDGTTWTENWRSAP
jgi:hypothetical protein